MLLRHLSYPIRAIDIETMFGWEQSRFSRVTQTLAAYIWNRWQHLFDFDRERLSYAKLQEFAGVIKQKGALAERVWGFIDGTARRVARTVRNQRMLYSKYKHTHSLRYLMVMTPDGLFVYVFGPVEGRKNDEALFKESNLAQLLEQVSNDPSEEILSIFGDRGFQFGASAHLLSHIPGDVLTPEEQEWNYSMSRVRETIEWAFGEVVRLFQALDLSKNQKVLLQPVGIFYLDALLLCNAHTIMYGSIISNFFGCSPPMLAEYFHGHPVGFENCDVLWQETVTQMHRK